MELEGKTIFVTGGTGFIGGRLVEKLLLEHGAKVRVLVRNYQTATWLSRTAAVMLPGDVTDLTSLKHAIDGSSLVIHCAASTSADIDEAYRINVLGTHNVLEAALEANVERVIIISSVAVHQRPHSGEVITEETQFVDDVGSAYARTKLASERLALHYGKANNLPIVVLRPTIVFGPRATFWTVDYVTRIANNKFAWSTKLDGSNNFVYVDNVVEAIVMAATKEDVCGEAFIIGGTDEMFWKDYIEYYVNMCGESLQIWPLWLLKGLGLLFEKLDKWISSMQKRSGSWILPMIFALRAVRKILKPLRRLGGWEIELFRDKYKYSISKSIEVLGYSPKAGFGKAIHETEMWLRTQRYLPKERTF